MVDQPKPASTSLSGESDTAADAMPSPPSGAWDEASVHSLLLASPARTLFVPLAIENAKHWTNISGSVSFQLHKTRFDGETNTQVSTGAPFRNVPLEDLRKSMSCDSTIRTSVPVSEIALITGLPVPEDLTVRSSKGSAIPGKDEDPQVRSTVLGSHLEAISRILPDNTTFKPDSLLLWHEHPRSITSMVLGGTLVRVDGEGRTVETKWQTATTVASGGSESQPVEGEPQESSRVQPPQVLFDVWLRGYNGVDTFEWRLQERLFRGQDRWDSENRAVAEKYTALLIYAVMLNPMLRTLFPMEEWKRGGNAEVDQDAMRSVLDVLERGCQIVPLRQTSDGPLLGVRVLGVDLDLDRAEVELDETEWCGKFPGQESPAQQAD